MSKDETSDYVASCVEAGIVSLPEIVTRLKEDIETTAKKLEDKLNEADQFRSEKARLTAILRTLDETPKVGRKKKVEAVPTIDFDDNSQDSRKLQRSICSVIEERGAMANRDLISKVGSYNNERQIIRAIKYLGENEILARDLNRKHVPGKAWDKRQDILT